jgi:hypothetical protein
MNPFVNPNKRGVNLPTGCKDLIDVLNLKESTNGETIRRFIRVVLFQVQQDNATELVIGKSLPKGKTPIRYKVNGKWHEMAPFPSYIRASVISELGQMAKFAIGQTAGKGVLESRIGSSRSQWRIEIIDADGECRFVRVPDEDQT